MKVILLPEFVNAILLIWPIERSEKQQVKHYCPSVSSEDQALRFLNLSQFNQRAF